MQRKKGQFASSRPAGEEGGPVSNWDGSQAPGQPLGSGGVQPEVTYLVLLMPFFSIFYCGNFLEDTPKIRITIIFGSG